MDDSLTLSDADVKVLRAIQANATGSARELAERLGMSPSTVWRRLNELEQVGAIKGRVAIVDPERVGFPVCVFVFVNLKDYEKTTLRRFERFVNATPEILECFAVTGTNDYTLITRSRSVGEFERLLMDRILAHDSVASATSQFALRQHKYSTALPI
ncbi:MAG: Lrp/AsnC family transcriptional regulator [Woeseiaceae bacterium]|nr:Lrp/AsnC family transcriptional regulator [Woeseiaceae bacterium]